MEIIYYSLTGNVRRFLKKAGCSDAKSIADVSVTTAPFIIVTGTIGFGEIPQPVASFLDQHHHHLAAVAASGNRNWGQNFGRAGERIAEKYDVPLLMKFELHGNDNEVEIFKEKVERLNENLGRETIQSY